MTEYLFAEVSPVGDAVGKVSSSDAEGDGSMNNYNNVNNLDPRKGQEVSGKSFSFAAMAISEGRLARARIPCLRASHISGQYLYQHQIKPPTTMEDQLPIP